MDSKKHQRKKSQGNIRSPLVKRDCQSQVTLRGWLYRLEGGALKQWKKRWFVLADYCLFYYKDADEEKMLGSILLPSYTISPSTNDDKVSKKFAFKAEHQNMKTYYFAADSKEVMCQWMNAMSLASIMQNDVRLDLLHDHHNPDEEDSGFTSYRSKRFTTGNDHNSTLNSSFASEQHSFHQQSSDGHGDNMSENSQFHSDNSYLGSGDKYPGHCGGGSAHPYPSSVHNHGPAHHQNAQSSYASAPPKPRRTGPKDPHIVPMSQRQYDTSSYTSDRRLDDNYKSHSDIYSSHHQRLHNPAHNPNYNSMPSKEYSNHPRRHPVVENGRNNCPPATRTDASHYAPTGAGYHGGYVHTSDPRRGYVEPNPIISGSSLEALDSHGVSDYGMREPQPPRPHSADFLERSGSSERKRFAKSGQDSYGLPRDELTKKQPIRPKSSLERYDPQSQWNQDPYYRDVQDAPNGEHYNQQRMKLSNQMPQYSANALPVQHSTNVHSSHTTNSQRVMVSGDKNTELQKLDHDMYRARKTTEGTSKKSSAKDRRNRPYSTGYQINEMLRKPAADAGDDSKKAQLREESMKRLLEWKQRMLQSPLTRKYSPRSPLQNPGSEDSSPGDAPIRPPLPEEYRLKVLRDLENHEAQLRQRSIQRKDACENSDKWSDQSLAMDYNEGKQPDVTKGTLPKTRDYDPSADHSFRSRERSRSATRRESGEKSQRSGRPPSRLQEHRRSSSSLSRLNNSYSSDDEEESLKERRRIRRPSQAGRAKRGSVDRSPAGRRNSSGKRDGIASSAPEYANLKALKDDGYSSGPKDNHERTEGNTDGYAQNKDYWNSNKTRSPLPDDLSLITNEDNTNKHYNPLNNSKESYPDEESNGENKNSLQKSLQSQQSNFDDNATDKKDTFNINREDYYLASRLFYPEKVDSYPDRSLLLRQILSSRNEGGEAKDSDKGRLESYQQISSERSPAEAKKEAYIHEETFDSRYRQNASQMNTGCWELDKDVGLPLPPYPNSGRRRHMKSERIQRRGSSGLTISSSSGKSQEEVDLAGQFSWQPLEGQPSADDLLVELSDSCFESHSQNSVDKQNDLSISKESQNGDSKYVINNEGQSFSDDKQSKASPNLNNCSFEEMRSWLQKQKEVPPPNIVQERIKHFEEGSNKVDNTKSSQTTPDGKEKKKIDKSQCVTVPQLEKKGPDLCLYEKDGHNKFFAHRRLHSDSETITNENKDADSTEDDVTSKSAPITLSPLSSVLADLRRTADTRKERKKPEKVDQTTIDEVIVTKGALRLSLAENKDLVHKKENSSECFIVHVKGRCEIPSPEEEAYLPMTGKSSFPEAEYVPMENNNSSPPQVASSQPQVSYFAFSFETLEPSTRFEEPVYDEPMSPPHSFLHDVYERHKSKLPSPALLPKHGAEENRNDSYEEENVYEMPDCQNELKMLSTYPDQSTETSDNAYEELYKVSSPQDTFRSLSPSGDHHSLSKEDIVHTSNLHFPRSTLPCKNPEGSIPDLLHHKEVKDSEASDADDEASRDFEIHRIPDATNYQTSSLDQNIIKTFGKCSLDDRHLKTTSHIYERRENFLRSVIDNTSGFDCAPIAQSTRHEKADKVTKLKKEISSDSDSISSQYPSKDHSEPLLKSISPKEQVSVRSKFAVHHMRICSESRAHPDIKSLPIIKSADLLPLKTSCQASSSSEIQISKYTQPTLSTDNVIYKTHSYFTNQNESDKSSTHPSGNNSLQYKHLTDSNSQQNFPQTSPTPDVVPNEAAITKEEINLSKKWLMKKTRRSPNSAPYYYSDLLPDNEEESAAATSGLEKRVSPRSSLLNNVRDLSPSHSSKGDIGRKVNKINENNSYPNSLSNRVMPEHDTGYQGHRKQTSGTTEDPSKLITLDLKSSLEELLSADSKKFLDTEKNKYEAGHTLQKTRQTLLSMAGLKQRASTPDLGGATNNKSDEPAYENIGVRRCSSTMLPKRLSRSLEGLSNVEPSTKITSFSGSHMASPNITENNEPYYENVQFVKQQQSSNEEEHTYETAYFISPPSKPEKVASPQACPAKHSVFDYSQIPSLHEPVNTNMVGTKEYQDNDRESDSEYLDRNILRRESEKHFLGKSAGQPCYRSPQHFATRSCQEGSTTSINFLAGGQRLNFDGGGNTYLPSTKSGPSNNKLTKLDLSEDEFYAHKEKTMQSMCLPPEDVSDSFSADSLDDLHKLTDESVLGFPKGRVTYSKSLANISNLDDQKSAAGREGGQNLQKIKDVLHASDSEIHVTPPQMLHYLLKESEGLNSSKRLSISAGDLLGKTHEELVLLLIQLRRNYVKLNKSCQRCKIQLESMQIDASKQESQREIDHLKQQLAELEKQRDLIQPLINLVDNMVKLGSLYGACEKTGTTNTETSTFERYCPSKEMLEFIRKMQETCFAKKEKDEWDKLAPSEENFEERLRHLYFLDHVLQEESSTFASLQQDKDILEKTLEGVKGKINKQESPVDMEKLRKQQHMIEKELARVRTLLAQSAKHLEETAAENAKMEHEVVLLQQKIEQALQMVDQKEEAKLTRVNLENELPKIQKVLDDLSSRRKEISMAVESLKAETQAKSSFTFQGVRASPTGVAGGAPLPGRKKSQSTYHETDLDTMETRDLALVPKYHLAKDLYNAPLYANVEKLDGEENGTSGANGGDANEVYASVHPVDNLDGDKQHVGISDSYGLQDINEADDRMKQYYGIMPREKPAEIKTVRIVKRESERRNKSRDKKKVSYDDKSLVWVLEEPEVSCYADDDEEEDTDADMKHASSLPPGMKRSLLLTQPQSNRTMSAHQRLFGSSPSSSTSSYSPDVKPQPSSGPSSTSKQPTKKSKRRHYTISGSHPALEQMSSKMAMVGLRARDDMDMERCLRTANTPDIVRSTIKKSEVYDEKIIERELGLPQKIVIPERYIEDEPEQLSAAERLQRSLKAETIRRMLSETATYEDLADKEEAPTETLKKKLHEEKKHRAHLLALNHALAREVMERSKVVAASVASLDSPQSAS